MIIDINSLLLIINHILINFTVHSIWLSDLIFFDLCRNFFASVVIPFPEYMIKVDNNGKASLSDIHLTPLSPIVL
jgi:hypothetical protein